MSEPKKESAPKKEKASKEAVEPKVVAAAPEAPAAAEEAAAPVRPSAPSAADLLKEDVDIKVRKAKGSKNVTAGIVHVLATFNNTKVTFTDRAGNVISWASSGKMNFRGSRKSTAYAAQVVTQDAGRTAMSHGMREVEVRLKGPGLGRDSAVRALQSLGFTVASIADVTPVPHNGCRPRKRRRV